MRLPDLVYIYLRRYTHTCIHTYYLCHIWTVYVRILHMYVDILYVRTCDTSRHVGLLYPHTYVLVCTLLLTQTQSLSFSASVEDGPV